ncbi:MAG: DUF2330 domain-containing protein [Myxococcota bacterium]
MLAFLLATPDAGAFCGTFVGAAGTSLVNNSSEVVMARDGDTTTLTLIMDYEGDAAEFALVLPVPEVLDADDVGSVDDVLLEWIAAYSQPRAVAYTCEDVFATTLTGSGCGNAIGCAMADGGKSGGVDVQSSFSAYGYDFVVLSAEESAGLEAWLAENGYAIPEGGEAILQEYIDAGSYFLAAKVSLEQTPTAGAPVWLPPIRLTYTSEVFSLPIRIGTISADGPQEVVIYTLTDARTGGEVGVSNYDEIELPTECSWPEGEALEDWYARKVDAALDAQGGAGWIREYSWTLKPEVSGGYHCDPCTAEPVAPGGTFAPFGLASPAAHLTRLRVRYTPETALEDLVLYESGVVGVEHQLKYVTYQKELEYFFPDCDAGWADDPGQCPDGPVLACGTPGVRGSAAALMAAMVLLRRRRAR